MSVPPLRRACLWVLALVPLASVLTVASTVASGPAGAAAPVGARLRRRRHDRVRRRGAGRPRHAAAPRFAGGRRRGHPRRQGLLAGQRRRRGLHRRRRPLRGLARATRRCRVRSWPWRPLPTARGTGWRRSTGGSSPSATPPFFGSMGGTRLNQPIVGMAATPDGKGYWLVAADGGIFSFGDARFFGSTGGIVLNEPIIAMAATPDGLGYWLVAADGGIFTFGDARFFGSWANQNLPDAVVGMLASPDGGGYSIATTDGVVLALGDAQVFGELDAESRCHARCRPSSATDRVPGTGSSTPTPGAIPSPRRLPRGGFPGSAAIVAAVASQIAPIRTPVTCATRTARARSGARSSPPGPGAMPVIPIPSYAFVGDIYDWAACHGALLPPTAMPDSGRCRPLRHRAPERRHIGARGDRGAGLARRGHRHRRRGLRGRDERLALGDHQRPLPSG